MAPSPRRPRASTTIYVALLRGINVGGNTIVSMAALRATFERVGVDAVRTYINSGNVVFRSPRKAAALHRDLERAITEDTGLTIPVLLRDLDEITRLLAAVPDDWREGPDMRCWIWFLTADADTPTIVQQLPHDPAIETVRYLGGAVVWRVDRGDAARSRMTKLVGTPLYRRMSARNINTVRTLHRLMQEAAGA